MPIAAWSAPRPSPRSKPEIEYILGARERRSVEVAAVLTDTTPSVSMTIPKADDRGTLDLQVKEVVRKVDNGAVRGVDCGAAIAKGLKDEVFDTTRFI